MNHGRFSPRAQSDLDEIENYIAADNPTAATKLREPFSPPLISSRNTLPRDGASSKLVRVTRRSAGWLCRATETI
jgi:plasmid stabilization system protein ParE